MKEIIKWIIIIVILMPSVTYTWYLVGYTLTETTYQMVEEREARITERNGVRYLELD